MGNPTSINIKDNQTVENLIVFKNSQTVRTLVMLCVSFNVGLILLITLFGLFLAEDKEAIMQSAFMAVSSFASNIGVSSISDLEVKDQGIAFSRRPEIVAEALPGK